MPRRGSHPVIPPTMHPTAPSPTLTPLHTLDRAHTTPWHGFSAVPFPSPRPSCPNHAIADAEKLPRPHHALAWLRRGTYPNGAMTAPQPHLGVGFHHSPRLGVAKEAQTMPEPSYNVVRA
ncbi:hypothetical protein PIB30_006583 [Stylosanthes scabra]|uniref:Uncharacterized protein n=1 Tax=Stylosanthes scabra TaxID=79078 RepID=A0ABU6Y0Y1_9FABA|nr:hypothetical protein [Stylosanthes scabra]